jgi:hypothetical protein
MEAIIVLAVVSPLALAVWLIVRAVSARTRIDELSLRIGRLELEVLRLKQETPAPAREAEQSPAPETSVAPAIPKRL